MAGSIRDFVFITEQLLCDSTSFNCTKGSPKCIPATWVCDGQEECIDGGDEDPELCGELYTIEFWQI